jgi:hypothetical protein
MHIIGNIDQWGSHWGLGELAGSEFGDTALPYLNLNPEINI